jgi:hypothetical protein
MGLCGTLLRIPTELVGRPFYFSCLGYQGSIAGMTNRSECASQYLSQMKSVWYLNKDQYKTCPSIDAPQKKNSIIVLLRVARTGYLTAGFVL